MFYNKSALKILQTEDSVGIYLHTDDGNPKILNNNEYLKTGVFKILGDFKIP